MNPMENAAVVGANTHGWRPEEEQLLRFEAQEARTQGRALRSVFDSVAKKTGRKPNSVRNFYYAQAREQEPGLCAAAFTPFTQDEIWALLVKVLGGQAKGVSVRACTLEMANGDTREMLRYQNKYRSLIKNNPAFVREVIDYMKENNTPVFDPYEFGATSMHPAGRPKKPDSQSSLARGVFEALCFNSRLTELDRRVSELESAVKSLEQDSMTALSLD